MFAPAGAVDSHFFAKKRHFMDKKRLSKKIEKNSKKGLTIRIGCDIITKSQGTERWLSWSKAHDWKSC